MNIVIGLLTVILVVVCLLMVLIVMMQRPKQEGLGAAFGGGMTDQMFGAQTTNVLQKGTVYLAVMFFGITLLLSVLVARKQNRAAALGSNLTDGKTDVAPEGAPGGDAGTGAQLLSELPLTSETATPATPATPAPTEGSELIEATAVGEDATDEPDASTPGEATPIETVPTPSEPAPSILDDAAPLPDGNGTGAPTEEAPTEEAPTEEAPTEEAPTEEAPTEEAPTEEAPTEEAPTEEAPTEEAPTEEAPAESTDAAGETPNL